MKKTPPNILFIFADDWGYGDLGCYGHDELHTPCLDKMANEGTRCTQFHVTSPVCSPSRCSAITGCYPARYDIHGHLARHDHNADRQMPNWLNPEAPAIGRLMQQADYRTAHYGKWHLGGGGGIHGHPDAPPVASYGYDDTRTWNGNGPTWHGKQKWPFTLHNDPDEVWAANCAESVVNETIAFIDHGADAIDVELKKPFFINLWLKDPHTPLRPTEEQREPYRHLSEPAQTYYSVISNADRQIGRLLDHLDASGLSENTLVIFSSDNGPENITLEQGTFGSTGGLRGRKRSLYEGGIRVPGIIRWPGMTPANVVSDALISTVDLLPTFLNLAGNNNADSVEHDGLDIGPLLRGEAFTRSKPLMWEWRFPNKNHDDFWPELGMRDSTHMMLGNPSMNRWELYDIANDETQSNNIAPQEPEAMDRLKSHAREWSQLLTTA